MRGRAGTRVRVLVASVPLEHGNPVAWRIARGRPRDGAWSVDQARARWRSVPGGVRWRLARKAALEAAVSRLSALASLPELHTTPTLTAEGESVQAELLVHLGDHRVDAAGQALFHDSRSALPHRMTNSSASSRARVSPERTVLLRPRPTARSTASPPSRPRDSLMAAKWLMST